MSYAARPDQTAIVAEQSVANEADDTPMPWSRAGHGGQLQLSVGIRPENWLSADSSQTQPRLSQSPCVIKKDHARSSFSQWATNQWQWLRIGFVLLRFLLSAWQILFWRSCECDSSSSVCLPRETLNLHTKLAQYSIGGEGSGSRIKSINSLPQGNFSQTSFSDSSSFSLLQEHIICDELFVYTATLFFCSFPRKGQIHLAPEDSAFQRTWSR